MRIGFVERLAAQTMASKRMTRNQALMLHTKLWAGLGIICFAIWAIAPIEKLTVERRGTEVPLDFLLIGCGILFVGLGALFLLSKEPE